MKQRIPVISEDNLAFLHRSLQPMFMNCCRPLDCSSTHNLSCCPLC